MKKFSSGAFFPCIQQLQCCFLQEIQLDFTYFMESLHFFNEFVAVQEVIVGQQTDDVDCLANKKESACTSVQVLWTMDRAFHYPEAMYFCKHCPFVTYGGRGPIFQKYSKAAFFGADHKVKAEFQSVSVEECECIDLPFQTFFIRPAIRGFADF